VTLAVQKIMRLSIPMVTPTALVAKHLSEAKMVQHCKYKHQSDQQH
jgi:hypothetical protein